MNIYDAVDEYANQGGLNTPNYGLAIHCGYPSIRSGMSAHPCTVEQAFHVLLE